MDFILDPFRSVYDMSTGSALAKALIALALSFVLCTIITLVYRATYQGNRYSQSFAHTIIIMGVVVSLIMMVIGNNVAVAFGLVGALSIIRFRTAMSDPKDIAIIFFSMAVGIACGLGYYLVAILFALTVSLIIYLLSRFQFGQQPPRQILRIVIPETVSYNGLFDDILGNYAKHFELIGVETVNLGTAFQLEYSVQLHNLKDMKEMLDQIRERNANLKVSVQLVPRTDR
jgi:uncharacterized membrane protein YhiD involved in acid resistance